MHTYRIPIIVAVDDLFISKGKQFQIFLLKRSYVYVRFFISATNSSIGRSFASLTKFSVSFVFIQSEKAPEV